MANMELTHLPDFDLSLGDLNEGIKQLIGTIKPEWDQETIEIKTLQGGYVNTMTHAFIPGDPPERGLVFRVYGGFAGLDIFDKDKDLLGLQAAYKAGCGAPVHAVFKNGLVVGFLPGRIFASQDYVNPEINVSLAKALAEIHRVDPTSIKSLQGNTIILNREKDTQHFWETFIRETLVNLPETLSDPEDDSRWKEVSIFTKEELLREYDEIWDMMQSLDIPIVFSHNDTQQRNIIYNEDENKVYLVDFEMCGFNHIHRDLTCFLRYFAYWPFVFGPVDETTKEKAQDDKVICSLIRSYLEATKELEGKPASTVSEDDVWELKLLTDLTTCTKRPGLDGMGCATLANKRYKERKSKERMFEIGRQYKEYRRAKQHKQP